MSTVELSKAERVELSQRATSRSERADNARRARLILLLEQGDAWAQLREKLSCNDAHIYRNLPPRVMLFVHVSATVALVNGSGFVVGSLGNVVRLGPVQLESVALHIVILHR